MNAIRIWLAGPISPRARIALWAISMVLLYAGLMFAQWVAPYLATAMATGVSQFFAR